MHAIAATTKGCDRTLIETWPIIRKD
jgi:hypothetical protein